MYKVDRFQQAATGAGRLHERATLGQAVERREGLAPGPAPQPGRYARRLDDGRVALEPPVRRRRHLVHGRYSIGEATTDQVVRALDASFDILYTLVCKGWRLRRFMVSVDHPDSPFPAGRRREKGRIDHQPVSPGLAGPAERTGRRRPARLVMPLLPAVDYDERHRAAQGIGQPGLLGLAFAIERRMPGLRSCWALRRQ